jgi:hypothetical protein
MKRSKLLSLIADRENSTEIFEIIADKFGNEYVQPFGIPLKRGYYLVSLPMSAEMAENWMCGIYI